jgi:hypothetical protein
MEPCVAAQLIFVFGFFAVVIAWTLKELLKKPVGCEHVESWEVVAAGGGHIYLRCKKCGKSWVEK